MTLEDLEKIVLQSVSTLDAKLLVGLDEEATYSNNDKEQFIEEFRKKFVQLKTLGLESLIYFPSVCKYCYPLSKAYGFYNPITRNFVVRYVIHQENHLDYRVEECKNVLLPAGEDGLPF